MSVYSKNIDFNFFKHQCQIMVNKIKINTEEYYSVDELNLPKLPENEIIYAKKINDRWVKTDKKWGCKRFIRANPPLSDFNTNTILHVKPVDLPTNTASTIKIRIRGNSRNKNHLYFNLSDILSNYCNKELNQTLVKTEYGISNLLISDPTPDSEYYINYPDLLKILVIHPQYLIPITDWVDEICSSLFKLPKISGIYLTPTPQLTLTPTENLQEHTNTQILYFIPISSNYLYIAKEELDRISLSTSDLTQICHKMDEIKNKYENEAIKKLAYLDKKLVQQELDFIKKIKELELENMKLQLEMIKQRLKSR
jgi:hypothetical protein